MLFRKYITSIYNLLLPVELIRPYPAIQDREKWGNIQDEVRGLITKRADRFKDAHLEPLRGTILLSAIQTGDYSEITRLYSKKTSMLTALSIAECMEDRGSYLEDILDTVWSICDMAIWFSPDKIVSEKNILEPIIDSYSAGVGFLLTYVWYLLKDRFDSIDTNIRTRFKYEVERRIMKPFMESHDQSTADILGEVIFPFLIFEDDYKLRHTAVRKSMEIADMYEGMNSDGLFRYFEMLYIASDGVFDEMCECTDSLSDISVLQYAYHTGDTGCLDKSYSSLSAKMHIDRIGTDLDLDKSLFLILNHDLIQNRFYSSEGT